jgi:hypothetical protein
MAQGPQGPKGFGSAQHANSGLNMAQQTTVTGVISAVQLAVGTQYPTIVINKAQIKVAPVWFLLDNGLELAAGEEVSVLVAPSNNSVSYLYAIRITKTAGGASIVLRNELGIPAWTGGGNGSRSHQDAANCSGCIDSASIKTATGTIDRVTAGAGIQYPSLVLKAADGSLLTIKIGPEHLILAADFELNPGLTLTVKYAQSTCVDELVALQLTGPNGITITLRNDDGTPVH